MPVTHQALRRTWHRTRNRDQLLHRFERDGWITLSREHIHIIKSAGCAASPAAGDRIARNSTRRCATLSH